MCRWGPHNIPNCIFYKFRRNYGRDLYCLVTTTVCGRGRVVVVVVTADSSIQPAAIECFFHTALANSGLGQSVYMLNHFIASVILHGERASFHKHSLSRVNFEDYSAVISFVNCNNNHWKFLFMHKATEQVFLVDPAAGNKEKSDSDSAAARFSEFFKMRRTRHGKTDWVDQKWRGGVIKHTKQKDSFSCGVFVMQMAVLVLANHPNVPQTMDIDPSKKAMALKRKEIACTILESSTFDKEHQCSMCAQDKPPGGGPTTFWIECESCERWFHKHCLNMTTPMFQKAKRSWKCDLC